MNDTMHHSNNTVPRWFVILAVVLAIWNLIGVMAFVMQMSMTADHIATLPDKEQMLYRDIPIWVNIAFACAVFGGAIGCIVLALKKAMALPILGISLIGVLVQMYHSFFIANTLDVYGPERMIMPVMVILIALYLVWLANRAKKKGWID